jgi:hypothetical protein
MDRIEIDVLDPAANAAVLKLPWRRFPGLLLQGDSLSGLYADARKLADGLTPGRPVDAELADDAAALAEALADLVGHYESVLREHGIPLPYVRDSPSAE